MGRSVVSRWRTRLLGTALFAWGIGSALGAPLEQPSSAVEGGPRFTWEGYVRSPEGTPLHGRHRLSLALFRGGAADEQNSGWLVYGEVAEVEVQQGRAVHLVGSGTPTVGALTADSLEGLSESADPGTALWLQVSFGDTPSSALPRKRLAIVPAAAHARNSELLGGLPAEAYVTAARLGETISSLAGQVSATVKAAGSGYLSFVGGGQNQDASGGMSGIVAGTDNHATWWAAFVGGGSFNWATGAYSAVAGGLSNAAVHDRSFVGGGSENRASGLASSVLGGTYNTASGANAMVLGGQANTASGALSLAAGRRAKTTAPGSFTWADSQDADYVNSTPNSFHIRAQQGAVVLGSSDFDALGVYNTTGGGIGVQAMSGYGLSALAVSGDGVKGTASTGNGVSGATQGDATKAGVRGQSNSNTSHGVIGQSSSGINSIGVWGLSTYGHAGYFSGHALVTRNLQVNGTLLKAAGSFRIDHPQDPANKYLSHSFVESPDMKNVYDGVVVLDEEGEATVELPAYFEALNRDFRYQLTTLGAPALVYIAQEIEENRFRIAGGNPGMKVSWQVTGIRKDPYAQAHPIIVEQEKPEGERGLYLHPKEHGAPEGMKMERPAPPQ